MEDSIDEEDAVEGFAKGFDLAGKGWVVGGWAVSWEGGVEVGEVEHVHFGGGYGRCDIDGLGLGECKQRKASKA